MGVRLDHRLDGALALYESEGNMLIHIVYFLLGGLTVYIGLGALVLWDMRKQPYMADHPTFPRKGVHYDVPKM